MEPGGNYDDGDGRVRRRSRSRPPLPERQVEPPHHNAARIVQHSGEHLCASCHDDLPDCSTTAWENWVYIAPGGNDADVLIYDMCFWIDFGPRLDLDLIWKDDYGSYLPLCKKCMFKICEIVFKTSGCDLAHEKTLKEKYKKIERDPENASHYENQLEYLGLMDKMERARRVIAGMFVHQLQDKFKNAQDGLATVVSRMPSEQRAKFMLKVRPDVRAKIISKMSLCSAMRGCNV